MVMAVVLVVATLLVVLIALVIVGSEDVLDYMRVLQLD